VSDRHTGLSHDLPEYVPNLPVRSKATVFKGLNGRWYWGHWCRLGSSYRSGPLRVDNMIGPPTSGAESWEQAFRNSLKHMENCR
jgi:hypothetical protein